jgi:hypothetical protein
MAMDLDSRSTAPNVVQIKTSIGAIAQEKTVRCRRGHSAKLRNKGHGARQMNDG